MNKKKAMSSEQAREVRQKGHDDALEFAKIIGLEADYQNNMQAKKDVVDHNGDTHSLKSGTKRWQIFLYRKNRFENDDNFQTMNGIGQILIKCLDLYPETYDEYKANKSFYKNELRTQMRELNEKFQEKRRIKSFMNVAMFNAGEVNYLTVKHENKYHVFLKKEVIEVFGENLTAFNSQATRPNETPEQKVVFKYNGKNVAELEMRNSNYNHYKEVLFVMNKLKTLELFFEKIPFDKEYNEKVLLYGTSSKIFRNK